MWMRIVFLIMTVTVARGEIVSWDNFDQTYGSGIGCVSFVNNFTCGWGGGTPSEQDFDSYVNDGYAQLSGGGVTNYFTKALNSMGMPCSGIWRLDVKLRSPDKMGLIIYLPQNIVMINSLYQETTAHPDTICDYNKRIQNGGNLAPAGFDGSLIHLYSFRCFYGVVSMYVDGKYLGILVNDSGANNSSCDFALGFGQGYSPGPDVADVYYVKVSSDQEWNNLNQLYGSGSSSFLNTYTWEWGGGTPTEQLCSGYARLTGGGTYNYATRGLNTLGIPAGGTWRLDVELCLHNRMGGTIYLPRNIVIINWAYNETVAHPNYLCDYNVRIQNGVNIAPYGFDGNQPHVYSFQCNQGNVAMFVDGTFIANLVNDAGANNSSRDFAIGFGAGLSVGPGTSDVYFAKVSSKLGWDVNDCYVHNPNLTNSTLIQNNASNFYIVFDTNNNRSPQPVEHTAASMLQNAFSCATGVVPETFPVLEPSTAEEGFTNYYSSDETCTNWYMCAGNNNNNNFAYHAVMKFPLNAIETSIQSAFLKVYLFQVACPVFMYQLK